MRKHRSLRPVKPNECEKVALILGFIYKSTKGSHKHFKKENFGKVTIPQYSEISGELFANICRQMDISKNEFFEILEKKEK
ncbi:addiction module toxin, HicA family [Candidatus Peregrinibacteria bacterium]|nr:addiction module toxin, HicA family [Candidatus Peregrinibacteria bacterium]